MAGTGLHASIFDPNNRFTLLLDGEVVLPCCGPFAGGNHTLIAGLSRGEHTVSLLRRSEPSFGDTSVLGLTVLGGDLLSPPKRAPQLEVIGDSISCGYGNEAPNSEAPFSVHTENHYLSYAARLARDLGAPLSTIAWSGRGVVRNHADGPGMLMPEMYKRTRPSETDATPWSFTDEAQLVLINLGTNDFGAPPRPSEARFTRGYVNFLRAVRGHRPLTPILCTLGPMLEPELLNRAQNCVRAAVEQRRSEGDANVHFHALKVVNVEPGTNAHPNVATHALMADELLPLAKRLARHGTAVT